MPNHVSCSLNVNGLGSDDFFAAVAAGKDDDFINHFVPMPEELRGFSIGACKIDGEVVNEWRDIDGKPTKITELDRQHMIDVHGTCDWYVWAQEHWGSKWSAYDVDVDATGRRILFNSAWSPPLAGIATISEMFPFAKFTIAYAEGGVGYWGTAIYRNGGCWDSNESDSFWLPEGSEDFDEGADLIERVTPECAAHLEEYSLHTGG